MKKLIMCLMFLVLISPVWAEQEWDKSVPCKTGVGSCSSADQRADFPADQQANNAAVDRLLANYREGMTLTYSSSTQIVVGSGEITCSNVDGSIRKMRKNPSSTNVVWSDLDTGAEEASKTYYIFANCDADAATATFKISASASAPTGITSYKRIGSFYNDASSNIISSKISNDNLPISVTFQDGKVNLDGKTLENVLLAVTTTGEIIVTTDGVNRTVPSGCYVYGGHKQSDGNFTKLLYACP